MPFTTVPKPYTLREIESFDPNQIGVYGLYCGGLWIYVGRGNIRVRLLGHLNGDNHCITRSQPTHWVAEVTTDMVARKKKLQRELRPVCSERVG